MASTVQTKYCAPGGTIFSSPVISAAELGALQPHDLVIDLARQQAQRQADHAGLVGQHPLDGEMGLAGVGGAEDGGDPPAGRRT